MFTIDDIKAGYLLEMDNGKYYTVNYNNRNYLGIGNGINNKNYLPENETYCDLMNFDDNLYCDWRKIKINKIYGRISNGFLDLNSPKGRDLLWDRFKDTEEYKVGDKFIINKITVQEINRNNYIKKIDYENIEARIVNIYNNQNDKLYVLYFDNNTIFVNKNYFINLKRIY